MNIHQFFSGITTFVFDVDGVLATSNILVMPDGEQVRSMNIRDGYALQLAVKKGYRVVIISGAESGPVKSRLLKLGITDVFQGVHDKRTQLMSYMESTGISRNQVLFMGDDIPDFSAMMEAGLPCCPADAVPEIRGISKYISPVNGGAGCARDVIEKVLKLHGHWEIDTGIASR